MAGDLQMKTRAKIILFSVLSITIILSGCTTTLPDDSDDDNIPDGLYVSLSGDREFTSIQEAIDQALENETVYVFSGTYNETININKTINLMGENPDNTIIDGSKIEDVITIDSAKFCSVTGFTIQNSGSSSSGIEIRTTNNIISDTIVRNCYNGIHCNRANDNLIFNNTLLLNNNYGVYVYNSNYVIARNNTFVQNEYGMRIKGSRHNEVISNQFKDNYQGMYFCCGATTNFAYYNTFVNNTIWNANDYVGGNIWYNEETSKGNYWDDYNGIDEDDDCVGDTPYDITSDGSKQDKYPLMEPWS